MHLFMVLLPELSLSQPDLSHTHTHIQYSLHRELVCYVYRIIHNITTIVFDHTDNRVINLSK